MGDIKTRALRNIIILPKNWYFCNSLRANQTLFLIQFSKNHLRRNLKETFENGLVCTASYAGGRSRLKHRSRTRFELCSGFAAKWNFPVFQPQCASPHRRSGWRFLLVKWWFSVARQRLQNKFCRSNFSDKRFDFIKIV